MASGTTLNNSHVAEETAVTPPSLLPPSSENGAPLTEKEEGNGFAPFTTPAAASYMVITPHSSHNMVVETNCWREGKAREIYGACTIPILDPIHVGFPPESGCDFAHLLLSNHANRFRDSPVCWKLVI